MSRLKIILLLIAGIIFVIGLFILQYILSVHSVKLTVKNPIAGKVYRVVGDKKEQLPQDINSSVTLQFQNGDYCVESTNKNYSATPICFTIKDEDLSVVVDPSYSKDYLAELLPVEMSSINTLIQDTYKDVIDGFVLKQGALLGQGDWYGGTLTQRVARSDQGDVYRFLLKKTGATWSVVAHPQIILSKFDYPEVPFSILDSVNRFVGVQGSL